MLTIHGLRKELVELIKDGDDYYYCSVTAALSNSNATTFTAYTSKGDCTSGTPEGLIEAVVNMLKGESADLGLEEEQPAADSTKESATDTPLGEQYDSLGEI